MKLVALPERTLVYLIKLIRSVRTLQPYVDSAILYSGQLYSMYRLIASIEYGNSMHVIAVALSAKRHPTPPSRARQYLASLENLASKLVTREYGHVDIDTYTFAILAYKFTRGAYSLADIRTHKRYSIAKLLLPYKRAHLFAQFLCSLYSTRCTKCHNGIRSSLCKLANHFCKVSGK